MVSLIQDDKGLWAYSGDIPEKTNKFYSEAFIRYFNIYYKLFNSAYEKCEFEFLLSLFRVRGIEPAGWDPYETLFKTVKHLEEINERFEEHTCQISVHLWIYGHIVEADEPYELIANLLNVCNNDRYLAWQFKKGKTGKPVSPSTKIDKIDIMASKVNMQDVVIPLKEIWNRELRNSIFHSDYSVYGNEVRVLSPNGSYKGDEINELINRALAYLDTLRYLQKYFIEKYTYPKVIDVKSSFATYPNEKAVVIVREGYGAVGLKDNLSLEEIKMGMVPYRIGRFYQDEVSLLEADSSNCLLPKRKT